MLASPPPIDPDDLKARQIYNASFKFYMRVDTPTPRGMFLIKFYTLQTLEQLCSQPNDIVSPKFSKCNISKSNGPIAFKFYTEVKYLKLHHIVVNDYNNTLTAFVDDTFVSPKSLKCNIAMTNCPIALKCNTGVKYQKLHTKNIND